MAVTTSSPAASAVRRIRGSRPSAGGRGAGRAGRQRRDRGAHLGQHGGGRLGPVRGGGSPGQHRTHHAQPGDSGRQQHRHDHQHSPLPQRATAQPELERGHEPVHRPLPIVMSLTIRPRSSSVPVSVTCRPLARMARDDRLHVLVVRVGDAGLHAGGGIDDQQVEVRALDAFDGGEQGGGRADDAAGRRGGADTPAQGLDRVGTGGEVRGDAGDLGARLSGVGAGAQIVASGGGGDQNERRNHQQSGQGRGQRPAAARSPPCAVLRRQEVDGRRRGPRRSAARSTAADSSIGSTPAGRRRPAGTRSDWTLAANPRPAAPWTAPKATAFSRSSSSGSGTVRASGMMASARTPRASR